MTTNNGVINYYFISTAILERITFVATPKHGSWLNVAEIELSVPNRVALKKRTESKEKFLEQIKAHEELKNHQAIPIDLQFTTKDARTKLKKLYPKV